MAGKCYFYCIESELNVITYRDMNTDPIMWQSSIPPLSFPFSKRKGKTPSRTDSCWNVLQLHFVGSVTPFRLSDGKKCLWQVDAFTVVIKVGVSQWNWLVQTLIWCGPSLAKFGLASGHIRFCVQNEERISMSKFIFEFPCITSL